MKKIEVVFLKIFSFICVNVLDILESLRNVKNTITITLTVA